jgi:hypothetical protein
VGRERSGPSAPPTRPLANRRRAYSHSLVTADRFDSGGWSKPASVSSESPARTCLPRWPGAECPGDRW